MLNRLIDTEVEYVKQFSKTYEDDRIIRFWDDKLPDMYSYNFTLIKDNVIDDFIGIVKKEIQARRKSGSDFLRIEFNFDVPQSLIERLYLAPQISKYDYMYIRTDDKKELCGNPDAIIKKATSEEVMLEGIEIDILANQSAMGSEFSTKRIQRKAEVYKDGNSKLSFYVCYKGEVPVGNCEFMIHNNIAKLEDFDIVENYQRQGFGTSVIKYILNQGEEENVDTIYLITESEDTAKEMYKKCGFIKVGEKTELFFDLSKVIA